MQRPVSAASRGRCCGRRRLFALSLGGKAPQRDTEYVSTSSAALARVGGGCWEQAEEKVVMIVERGVVLLYDELARASSRAVGGKEQLPLTSLA